jgi:ABC-type transporter Mla subunit MlaD
MRTPLEDFFNLPHSETENITDTESDELVEESTQLSTNVETVVADAKSTLDVIKESLPQVSGLDNADKELDEIASLATETFKDLVDLGSQVEARFASELYNAASSLLGHALSARTTKLNKKLKIIELQMKQVALEQKKSTPTMEEEQPQTTATVYDRNALLAILKEGREKG